MKMNLRRIAAWILTALLIVSCLPIQAIGQGREEYSAPVSFGNELDDGTDETKTLTFSWDDAYDSYVYDTTQFNMPVRMNRHCVRWFVYFHPHAE